MNMEEEGNAYTCLDTRTQEFEKGRCRWKRRIGIWAGSVGKTKAEDAKKEGTAPGVPQGTGTACRCMRRTVSLCHVALSTDSRLLIQVRPPACGPSSTTFNRRSWSKMAPADMIYSQGRGESGHDEKRRHNVCPYPRACHTTAC